VTYRLEFQGSSSELAKKCGAKKWEPDGQARPFSFFWHTFFCQSLNKAGTFLTLGANVRVMLGNPEEGVRLVKIGNPR
jgi:hypothetical protein